YEEVDLALRHLGERLARGLFYHAPVPVRKEHAARRPRLRLGVVRRRLQLAPLVDLLPLLFRKGGVASRLRESDRRELDETAAERVRTHGPLPDDREEKVLDLRPRGRGVERCQEFAVLREKRLQKVVRRITRLKLFAERTGKPVDVRDATFCVDAPLVDEALPAELGKLRADLVELAEQLLPAHRALADPVLAVFDDLRQNVLAHLRAEERLVR